MPAGISVLRNSSRRARAARATSTAFCPGFLVRVSVTAGNTCPGGAGAPAPASWAVAVPGVNQTNLRGWRAPSSIRATSRRYTGRALLTPTTSEPTSSAEVRNSPVSTLSIRAVAPAASSTAPAGNAWFAAASVACRRCTSTPRSRNRFGSSQTLTARPGPPMVCTSRAPGTRLSSASSVLATRSISKADISDGLHSVTPSTGTSSMPLGLTTGASTPRFFGNQSWLALSTS